MGRLENHWRSSLTRRAGLRNVAAFFASSPILLGQQDRFRDHSRVPGIAEMVTAFEGATVVTGDLVGLSRALAAALGISLELSDPQAG